MKASVLLELTGISTTNCKLECKDGELDLNFVTDARKLLVQELKPTFEKLITKSSQLEKLHVGTEIKSCDDIKVDQMSLISQRPLVGSALSFPSHATFQETMVESSVKEVLSLRKGQDIVKDVQRTLAEAIREARIGYSRPKAEIENFDGSTFSLSIDLMHMLRVVVRITDANWICCLACA